MDLVNDEHKSVNYYMLISSHDYSAIKVFEILIVNNNYVYS